MQRAAAGDAKAWDALWDELEPWLESVVAHPRFLRRVGQRETDRRNILIEVIARMRANNFERLKLFLAARRTTTQLDLRDYLRVTAKRACIDNARRVRDETQPAIVCRLLECAAKQLHEPALSALELWVQGVSLEAIAEELALPSLDAARALVQTAMTQVAHDFVYDELDAQRRTAEAAHAQELACARYELMIAAGHVLDEHLRLCAPCRGVAETINELSLRE